jgi:hypothetical protein
VRRRSSIRDDATLFAGRGDRRRIEQLRRVLLEPPPRPPCDSVDEAAAVYLATHPGASREEVYRNAVVGRGLPGGRKRDALRVIDSVLEAAEQRRRGEGRGNGPGTSQRGIVGVTATGAEWPR